MWVVGVCVCVRVRVGANGKADFIFQRPVTVGNMKGATPKKSSRGRQVEGIISVGARRGGSRVSAAYVRVIFITKFFVLCVHCLFDYFVSVPSASSAQTAV